MGVPQSRRPKRCRPLRRRLRRRQRGEQIVGGLRRRVVRAHSRPRAPAWRPLQWRPRRAPLDRPITLPGRADQGHARTNAIFPFCGAAGDRQARTSSLRLMQHGASARRWPRGWCWRCVPRRAWPHVTTHPQVGRMRAIGADPHAPAVLAATGAAGAAVSAGSPRHGAG